MKNARVVEELVVLGTYDWLAFEDVVGMVQKYSNASDSKLRARVLDVVQELVENGLAKPGDVDTEFVPWEISLDEVLTRIDEEWLPDMPLNPGSVCWLCTTAEADLMAESVTAKRDSERDA